MKHHVRAAAGTAAVLLGCLAIVVAAALLARSNPRFVIGAAAVIVATVAVLRR